jgi:geranylgeranyl pyrophosphate synthase
LVFKITKIPPNPTDTLPDYLQQIVDEFGVWGSFNDVIRQSLVSKKTQELTELNQKKFSWVELPDLCCQAVGGDPAPSPEVKTAWGLLYTAAHLMDAVVDGDNPDEWWVSIGPPAAINVATALYGCSGLALRELFNKEDSYDVAIDILGKFQHTILKMCAGQHLELTKKELSLEDYWRVAKAKSGSFFGLACYAGARLATDDPDTLVSFLDFGFHLGIIIQIGDDGKDIWSSETNGNSSLSNPLCLLPVIYALSVLSEEKSTHLLNFIHNVEQNPELAGNLHIQLEGTGADLYIVTKVEQHRLKALQALQRLNIQSAIYNRFEKLLSSLSFIGLE